MGVDWTAQFRDHDSVQAYTLVGEADHGNCGNNWLTWGNPSFAPPDVTSVDGSLDGSAMQHSRKKVAAQAPYRVGVGEHDRFRRVNVDTASKYQLQRYDSVHDRFNSRTVSFIRTGLKGV